MGYSFQLSAISIPEFQKWSIIPECVPLLYLVMNFRIFFLIRQHRTFNKTSGRWGVSLVKVEKAMNISIFCRKRNCRLNGQHCFSHAVLLNADDQDVLGRPLLSFTIWSCAICQHPDTHVVDPKHTQWHCQNHLLMYFSTSWW